MSEKSYQAYFMKLIPHGYRTSLTSGSGFPDLIMFHEDCGYSLVELKLLLVGPSGNKKLKNTFQLSQPSWYTVYIHKGGDRLFIAFKLNKGFGLLKVTKDFLNNLNTLTYKDMLHLKSYTEYPHLKQLIEGIKDV